MSATIEEKKKKVYILKRFFSIMGVKPVHIITPIILSFITVSFSGIGTALLIPLAKGFTDNNYDFIKNNAVLREAIATFPKFTPGAMNENTAMFLFLSLLIFIAMLLKNIFGYFNGILVIYWNGNFSKKMNIYVFDRFISFGKLYFDKVSQGYINTVISYSGDLLRLINLVQDTFRQGLNILVNFFIMLFISWQLSLFTVAVFPVLHFSLRIIIRNIEKVAKKQNLARISLGRKVFDILSSIPLIKAYAKEAQMSQVYSENVERLRELEFRRVKMERLAEPIQNIIILTALLSMVALVAFFPGKGKHSNIGSFVVFFYIARETLPMFAVFNRVRLTFVSMKPAIREVAGILGDEDKFFIGEGEKEFNGLKNGIRIENLRFSYRQDKPVLEDINLLIEKGKMTAIVGPTGSGKTTLASLIMRFYDCAPGTITIDGIDIREFKAPTLRAHASIVTQDVFLFNDTIGYNIAFAARGKVEEEKIIDVVKKARLYDFVVSLPKGLETEVGDRGIRLSGGERQRVAIARALLRATEILILDEATSSLDTKTERLIQQSIDEAIKGRTTIVIAHRLSTIKHADKIVVLDRGRIVEEGSLDSLLTKKGIFYQYWQEQKFY
jgi:subfamily B ATP-binding cassette protein MsbA